MLSLVHFSEQTLASVFGFVFDLDFSFSSSRNHKILCKARKLWPCRGPGPVFWYSTQESSQCRDILAGDSGLWELRPQIWHFNSLAQRHLLVYAFRYVERYVGTCILGCVLCLCVRVYVSVCVCDWVYGKQRQPTIVKTKRREYLWCSVYMYIYMW